MSEKFKVEIVRPDNKIFSEESDEVTLPCYEGQLTILKDHIPFITFLRPGIVEISKKNKFFVEDGTIEFYENNLLILLNQSSRENYSTFFQKATPPACFPI